MVQGVFFIGLIFPLPIKNYGKGHTNLFPTHRGPTENLTTTVFMEHTKIYPVMELKLVFFTSPYHAIVVINNI